MSVRRVWLALPRRRLALLGAAAAAATVLAGIGLMATSGYLIARTAERPPILDLMVVFAAVRFFGLARPALRYADRLVSHDATFRLLHQLRHWFVAALLPLAPARLADFRSGDLLARLAGDVESLRDVHLRLVAPALAATIVTGVAVAGIYQVDRQLAGIVLLLLAANGLAWPLFTRRWARGLGRRRNQERAAMSAGLVPLIQGIGDVLAFGREADQRSALDRRQDQLDALQRHDGSILAGHAAMASLTAQMGLWAALWLLVPAVQEGRLSGVWLAAVALGVVAAFEAVEALPSAWQAREQIADAAGRVWSVVDAQPAVRDPAPPHVRAPFGAGWSPEASGPATLGIVDVSFSQGASEILRKISFDAGAGEHIALIGPSGAGKSTVLALLARVWDPASGLVAAHGVDVRHIPLAQLRASVAMMPQQIHVFNDTLRENVRIGRPAATDEDIVRVLRQASLETLLTALPEGLDARLGEHGNRLSAGERQRLGLARLMLSDAPIALVDEPTAHLDTETERDVLQALRAWARGRTLLLVTHRLDDLETFDRVIVMEGGRVVDEGPAAILARRGGPFAKLRGADAGLLRG